MLLYSYSGTGKIFRKRILLSVIKIKRIIILNVLLSKIVSLLLSRRKIVHYIFCIWLLINENSSFYFTLFTKARGMEHSYWIFFKFFIEFGEIYGK